MKAAIVMPATLLAFVSVADEQSHPGGYPFLECLTAYKDAPCHDYATLGEETTTLCLKMIEICMNTKLPDRVWREARKDAERDGDGTNRPKEIER